jgi:acetyltransferase-like isoleucine patch superfamily enzyme
MLGWNEEIKKKFKSCGENVFIGHNVMFARPELVELGNNVRIDPFTYIGGGLVTGDYIQICSHNTFPGKKTIYLDGWNFVAYGCKLITGSEDFTGNFGPVNDYWGKNKVYEFDIRFKKYSGVCSDCIVMPGVELPEGTVYGAKSFIGKNHKADEFELWINNKKHTDRNKSMIITQSDKWSDI